MRRILKPVYRRAKPKFITALHLKPRRVRSDFWADEDGGYAAGAHTVLDDPREPIITDVGILDERGVPLMRVTFPVKVQIGFHVPGASSHIQDCVECVLPSDHLSVTDIRGHGMASVDAADADTDDD